MTYVNNRNSTMALKYIKKEIILNRNENQILVSLRG